MASKTFWIINQTAGSPYHGMVYRNYYIAREWVKQGHKAVIISGSNFHNFHTKPNTSGLFTHEVIDGIDYWWVKMPAYGQSRSLGRLFSIFLFPILLLLFPFWRLARPDTVIVSGPPHLPIMNAWFWSRIHNSTLVYEIRDLWPLTIQKLGNVSAWHPLILILSLFERLAFLASDRVVSVLSLAWRHCEAKGMSPAKFAYIPNGIDLSNYQQIPSSTGRSIADISKDKFTIIYAGSFGIANHLDQLMGVAKSMAKLEDVAFVLVGDGPHKKSLMEEAKGLKNVFFFPYVPKEQIPYILQQADVGFIGFVKTDLYQFGVSPNKIFDYMAAELPILMVLDSEDDIIERAQAGLTVRSDDCASIQDGVLKLKKLSQDKLQQLGMNGRAFLEENHVYDALAARYLKIADEGRRPAEEAARWVVSPFMIGFWGVMIIGAIAHFLLPWLAPHLFVDGITNLLKDPQIYHRLAIEVANAPWSEFSFRPKGQFPAGALGLIYKLTSIHRPFMMLPLLAAMAGLTIRTIVSCLDILGVRGRWWPLVIGIVFTVTPTSLSWMIYPHKDAFIVPGAIILTWTLMSATLRRIRLRHFASLVLGSLLVFSSKPYFAELFFAGTLLAIPFAWFQPASTLGRFGRMIFFGCTLVVFALCGLWKDGYSSSGESWTQAATKSGAELTPAVLPRHQALKETWKPLPGGAVVNKPLYALVYTRERFLNERPYGLTNFMPEVQLKTGMDAILFIPRALQLAVLEPLPWNETEGGRARQLVHLLLKFEMLFVYFSILCLVFSGRKSFTPAVMIALCLALPFLFALGFASPNIGTINRYRFPFLILLKIAGLAALWNSDRLRWPGRLLMWIDPPQSVRAKRMLLFLVPDDQTFIIQRLVMARAAQAGGYEVHVACPDLGFAQQIRDIGFIHHNIDLNRGGLNPFADLTKFVKLVLFLARLRPDILQNVSIKPVIYGSTAGTIVGLKRIVNLVNGLGYAFDRRGLKGEVVHFVAVNLYRNALALPGVRVIFQNPDDRKYFIDERMVEETKTILIRGSGVDMKKFTPTPLPLDDLPIVLFVGRLLWSKGIQELVDAAKILRREGLSFRLQIVGAPDDRNPEAVPSEVLKEWHANGVIEWLGRQTEMPRFYRQASILCLPTNYREGLPLTLLEAASIGRPLVATDVSGCREAVEDGVNGFLVPPKDTDALAGALRQLISNPDLRKKMGEASTRLVVAEFSSDHVQRQLLAVYDSLFDDALPQTSLSPVPV